jgi:oligopeptide/dipeptide ABC transporter ATP-binding protein
MCYLPSNGGITAGRILFKGEELRAKSSPELRMLWGDEIAMVYQDPRTSLNPCIRVGHQIAEVLQIHRGLGDRQAWLEALKIVELVNIPDPQFNAAKYPHQLSGGMQQRIVIASILYITHDLSVIAQVSDRVGIIYAGEMIESGPVGDIFHHPIHPYTIGLLQAIPDVDLQKPFKPIEGQLPDRIRNIPACVFAPRCEFKMEQCESEKPGSYLLQNGHFAKCFWWEETSELLSDLSAVQERSHRLTYNCSVRIEYPFSRIRCLALYSSFAGGLFIISL